MHLLVAAFALVCTAHAQDRKYDQYLYQDEYFERNCRDTYQPYNMSRLMERDFVTFKQRWEESRSDITRETQSYLASIWKLAYGDGRDDTDVVEPAPVERSPLRKSFRAKRQAPRLRKEYRSLTIAERADYHKACIIMKADMVGGTSKYDLWVQMHRTPTGAHMGPAFLPWHRVFLYLFETALRVYRPDVVLPYFDNSIDRYLANPMSSIMWTTDYMGSPNGDVTVGAFAGWIAEDARPLRREVTYNIAQLYSNTAINSMQSSPNFNAYYGPAESNHNGVHGYVGGANGHMIDLGQANDDPIFWMHHAFVDCLWETWRQDVQIPNGLNPQTDYPAWAGPHNLDAIMSPFSITVRQGLGRQYESLYSCAPRVPPQGSDECCCSDTNTRPNGEYSAYSYSPDYPPPPPSDYEGRVYSDRVYSRVRVQYEGRNPYRDPNYRPYDPYSPDAPSYEAPATDNGCCDTQNQYVMADCQGQNQYAQYSRGYTSVPDRYAVNEGYVYFPISYVRGRGQCYLNVYTPGGGRPCRPFCYNRETRAYEPCCGVFNVGPSYGYTAPVYGSYAEAMNPTYGSDGRPVYVDVQNTYDDIVYHCPNPDPYYKEYTYRGRK